MEKAKRMVCLALVMALAIGLGAAFMSGCKKSKDNAAAGGKEIKIGAIFAVTGKASFLGDPEKKTIEMLADELNKSGGINGMQVQFIIEDDAGDEAKAKDAAMKLIDKDGVLAIIGPSQSGTSMKIKDLVNEKKVPMISCAAAEAIITPVTPYVFKTPQKDSFVADMILSEMKKEGITKVAMLFDASGFGQEGNKQIKALAAKYGVELVLQESYKPNATDEDIKVLLTKIGAIAGVQAVINWSVFPPQSTVPKLMKELGLFDKGIKLFHSHGFGNIKYVTAAGAAADGIIFPAGRLLVANELPDTNAQKATLVKYKTDYEGKYKEDVSTFGGHAYDAFQIIVAALKKAGPNPTRDSLRDAIEATQNFPGTGGVFNFSKEDHNGLTIDSLDMMTVKDGKFVLFNKQ